MVNIKPDVLSKNTITLFYKSNHISLHKTDWLRLACCLYFSMFSWAQWQHYVSVVDESVYPIVMNTPTWTSRHWFKKKTKQNKNQTNCTHSESHCSFNSLKKKKSRTLIQFSAELHKHSRITSMDQSRFTVQQQPNQDMLPTLLTLQNKLLRRTIISQQHCIARPWMINEATECWRLFLLLNDIRGSRKRGLREHEEGWRLSTH